MARPLGSRNKAKAHTDNGEDAAPKRNSISGSELSGYISRIEALNAQQKELSVDRSQVYKEIREAGIDRKSVQEIVRRRKMTREQRQEAAATLDMYLSALGDFADTPLGRAGAEAMQAEAGAE